MFFYNNKYIYKLANKRECEDCVQLDLKLVAGVGYYDMEFGEFEGWRTPDHFVESVQTEMISFDYINESLTEAAKAYGFKITKNLETIV